MGFVDMPWQGQLVIGEKVWNYDDAAAIFKKLGCETDLTPPPGLDEDEMLDFELDVFGGVAIKKQITYKGVVIDVSIYLLTGSEGGVEFPVPGNDENPKPDYTDALVGFYVTSRYSGAVLDKDTSHGRHEPFVFDPTELAELLSQVREWWPEAQAMIWTVFY